MSLVKFIDSIGRTILGEDLGSTEKTLQVKNPVMINVIQQPNGQLQVQLIPLFFAEFISPTSRTNGSTWSYNLNSITLGDVDVDARLVEQYTRIFAEAVPAPAQSSGEQVIKLFDE